MSTIVTEKKKNEKAKEEETRKCEGDAAAVVGVGTLPLEKDCCGQRQEYDEDHDQIVTTIPEQGGEEEEEEHDDDEVNDGGGGFEIPSPIPAQKKPRVEEDEDSQQQQQDDDYYDENCGGIMSDSSPPTTDTKNDGDQEEESEEVASHAESEEEGERESGGGASHGKVEYLEEEDEMNVPVGTTATTTTRSSSPSPEIQVEWISSQCARVKFLSSSSSSAAALLISGRGYLSCLQGSIQVHGYQLDAPANSTSTTTTKAKTKRIPFDCPQSWSNWLTLSWNNSRSNGTENDDEPPCCVVQIDSMTLTMSSSSSSLSSSSFYRLPSPPPPLLSAAQPTLQASFALYPYNTEKNEYYREEPRPTVLPQPWKQAATDILEDYVSHCIVQQQQRQKQKQQLLQTAQPPSIPDTLNHNNSQNSNMEQNTSCFVVAICGAKGVGKSTFLRYLLHRFLSSDTNNNIHNDGDENTTEIAILDADLGQPEFAPPCLVTLTAPITQPLLSPPHMHMVAPRYPTVFSSSSAEQKQWAYFLGCTAASQSDPHAYQEAIGALLQQYSSSGTTTTSMTRTKNRVILVNLPGWVKGLGEPLMQALIQQTLQPSHVVQLHGPTPSQQFHLGTTDNTLTSTIHHIIPSYNSPMPGSTPLELLCSNNNSNHVKSLPPAALRTLRLCTYFLQNDISLWERIGVISKTGISAIMGSHFTDEHLEIPNRLAALTPYIVPLSSVELLDPLSGTNIQNDDNNNDQADLYPWNTTLVGLCCRPINPPGDNGAEENGPWYLLPCLGLGLIRSIDVARKWLYILTPVDPQQLSRVNVLIKTHMVGLPLEMTHRGVDSECFPYQQKMMMAANNNNTINNGTLLLGTTPMRSRNTMVRRSHIKHYNNLNNNPNR